MLDQIQIVHISTAGIIPSEAEMTYPFNAYDHDGTQMTEAAKEHFTMVTFERLVYWLSKYGHRYDRVIFYLRGEGKTYNAALNATDITGLDNVTVIGADMSIPDLPWAALPDVDDCLTNKVNLKKLIDTLRG